MSSIYIVLKHLAFDRWKSCSYIVFILSVFEILPFFTLKDGNTCMKFQGSFISGSVPAFSYV
jgi:hypothetical protein